MGLKPFHMHYHCSKAQGLRLDWRTTEGENEVGGWRGLGEGGYRVR